MNRLIFISLFCLIAINCYSQTTFSADSLDKSVLEFSELSPRCNNQGYLFDTVCYCFAGREGNKCQKKTGQGWYDKPNGCDDLDARLDSLLNENPKKTYIQDNMFPRLTGNSIGSGQGVSTWIPMVLPKDMFSIFPKNVIMPYQVAQGDLGDCYFMASMASLAYLDNGHYIRNMFMTKPNDPNHIYVTRWFIDGRPVYVSVDDFLPGTNGQEAFSHPRDGGYWVQILEKSYAKIFGSYKAINGGTEARVLQEITGAPTIYKYNSAHKPDQVFDELLNAFQRGYPMGAGTPSSTSQTKLVPNHAYAVLGLYTVTSNGKQYKLMKCYNPWGTQDKYKSNPWFKTSKIWTPELKKQVGYMPEDDGQFFLDFEDFHANFETFEYAQVQKDYQVQFKDIALKKGLQTYKFTVNVHQKKDFSLALLQQNTRLLPNGCKQPYTLYNLNIQTPSGKWLYSKWGGNNNLRIELPAKTVETGTYHVQVQVTEKAMTTPYFTVSMYNHNNAVTFDSQPQIMNALNNKEHPEVACPNECSGNGVCNLYNGQCKCNFSWKGKSCETKIPKKCPSNCGGNGICQDDNKCYCYTGYQQDKSGSCIECKDGWNLYNCQYQKKQGHCHKASYAKFIKRVCVKYCGIGTCGKGASRNGATSFRSYFQLLNQ